MKKQLISQSMEDFRYIISNSVLFQYRISTYLMLYVLEIVYKLQSKTPQTVLWMNLIAQYIVITWYIQVIKWRANSRSEVIGALMCSFQVLLLYVYKLNQPRFLNILGLFPSPTLLMWHYIVTLNKKSWILQTTEIHSICIFSYTKGFSSSFIFISVSP